MDLAITRTFTNFVVIFSLQKFFATDRVCFYRTGQNYFLLQNYQLRYARPCHRWTTTRPHLVYAMERGGLRTIVSEPPDSRTIAMCRMVLRSSPYDCNQSHYDHVLNNVIYNTYVLR